MCDNSSQCGKARNLLSPKQGRRSQRKSAGAKGGTFFWSGFLLHIWAIWKNDPFSKFQKVPGLKPRLVWCGAPVIMRLSPIAKSEKNQRIILKGLVSDQFFSQHF